MVSFCGKVARSRTKEQKGSEMEWVRKTIEIAAHHEGKNS